MTKNTLTSIPYPGATAFCIALFASLIFLKFVTKDKDNSENFWFQVAQPNKCTGAMKGKPSSFQFDAVGNGECKPEKMPPYGFITNQHQCVGGNNNIF